MTGRERVLAAINHREADRVPIDFGGHRSSGIAATTYARLKRALGISTGHIRVYDVIQQLAIIEPEVLDAVGADTVEVGRAFMRDGADWQDWVLPDGTPCQIPACVNAEQRGEDWYLLSDDGVDLALQKRGCLYFEQIHWPWRGRDMQKQDFEDLAEAFAHAMWTAVPAPGKQIGLDEPVRSQVIADARRLRESTDRAILGLFGGNLFEVPQFLYGIDEYLLNMGLYPDACKRLSERLCELYLEKMEKWLGTVGPYIDVMVFGDDLGGQTGPMMSPRMYREYYKPWHARLWRRAKELAPHVCVKLHSCGSIEPLLEDLIDAGLQASNPVQITCAGMSPEHLKGTFGGRFVFWGGGCDTRQILPRATPAEVTDHVRRMLDIWAPGGGYVFQQVHNILDDVPVENILAMFEAVREYRCG